MSVRKIRPPSPIGRQSKHHAAPTIISTTTPIVVARHSTPAPAAGFFPRNSTPQGSRTRVLLISEGPWMFETEAV